MNFLKNKEVKTALILDFIILIFASVLALIQEIKYGIFTFFICLLLIFLHMLTNYKRYKTISSLCAEIDRILHGYDNILIDKYNEGELAVLSSEIYKMTIRLREQQYLLQQDKKYLSDSIADISHQIRTPLTSVNLLVSFLSEPNISYERRLKLTNELSELLKRIDWLITTLLKISKLDAGTIKFKNEEISLQNLLKKSLEPLLIPIELREQSINVNAEGYFCGDIQWTAEALGNIIKNCMEHTPTDGSGKLNIEACENAVLTEIIITDNGCGIDSDDLPYIFERFYKGKKSDDKSFGIGLALSRMIITSQNGSVKAENNRDGGARFIIKFYKSTV